MIWNKETVRATQTEHGHFAWSLPPHTDNLLTDSNVDFVFAFVQCKRDFAAKREMVQ